ncbi:MAG: hypothetical protein E7647_01520 [Ruminococcaceae bacterium]|nr:hypothetical protein [Oscillospiraceae bacterium]
MDDRIKDKFFRTRTRKHFDVGLLSKDEARSARKRFEQKFLMSYEEYSQNRKNASSERLNYEEYLHCPMVIKLRDDVDMYSKEAMKLLRSMGESVLFMSESQSCDSCEGIKLGGTEEKGFVATCEPNALADRIIYEWRLYFSIPPKEREKTYKGILPFNLYIFDTEYTKCIAVTDLFGEYTRTYTVEDRICYAVGFDKKLMQKYSSKVVRFR